MTLTPADHPGGIPDCEQDLHPLARLGIQLFNRQEFFKAHEALETAWKEEKGPIRDLYRGILQVAVGYYHIQRGNITGARKMFKLCRGWLDPFPGRCRGVNLAQLIEDYQAVESRLDRLESESAGALENIVFPPILLT